MRLQFDNPYRSARTGPSDASGPGRSSAALERTFLALTGSLAPTLKKIAELRATFSRFAARLSRFGAPTCSPEAPQDVPGRDFEAQNGCFFEVFACGKHPTRKTSDIDKTLAGAIRNALRSCRAVVENVQKSIRKRFRLRWAMRRALTGVLGVVPNALGAFPKRPEAAIGRFLAALDAPGVPQDRLWGGTWGFKGRPRQVWTRS